jgi:ribosomal-protein-alanine N-acetyltransferase
VKNDLFPPLETDRLRLRCVVIDDAAAASAMMTPGISRWVASWPVPFTHDMAVKRIRKSRALARSGNALPFAIIEKGSEALIGCVAVDRDLDHPRRGALGYWVGEPHHGKGYMREVAGVVLAAGFDLLDLDIIEATAHRDNVRSSAVMRSCGMRPAGERMFYASARDRYEPCLVYEILRPRISRQKL